MEKSNIGGLLTTMRTIYGALLIGLLSAAFFLFPEMKSYDVNFEEGDFLAYIIPAALFAAIFLGEFLFKRTIAEVKDQKDLTKKFTAYQTGMLLRLAPVEGVAFFSIFQLQENSNAIFLYAAGAAILYLIYLFPSKARISKELRLSEADKRLLNNA